MRSLTISLVAAAAMAGFTSFASAQSQQAGVSAAVRGQVALARASGNIVGKQVQSGDPIFLGDAITSGKASGLQIMLLDETVFTIGPNSEISIDEFVYDPSTGSGKVAASVAKGAFRFITGKIARKRPEDMTVRLPTATIGIRGTIVAGVVRSAPGDDPSADAVFKQLQKDSPGAENARDFVVLLGPGHENNTNDKGGEFVFTANPPEKAQRGLSAGSSLAQGTTPDFASKSGAFGLGGVTVSRRGSAAVGFEDGDPQGPFFVSDFARLFTRVFPATIQGIKPANDPNAKEANSASSGDANSLSGNAIGDTVQVAGLQTDIADTQDGADDNVCPTCDSGGSIFDFNDLRAITSGTGQFSGGLNMGPFSVSSAFFNVNFGNTTFQFDLNIINGGGLSSAQIGCFSSCNVNYGGLSGPAVFTEAQADTNVGCSSCGLTMQFTSSNSINVTLEHDGNAGSTAVNLQ